MLLFVTFVIGVFLKFILLIKIYKKKNSLAKGISSKAITMVYMELGLMI